MGDRLNSLDSIAAALNQHVRDHSQDHRDAWIYGIAVGWGDALTEVAAHHRWSDETVTRLKALREQYVALEASV